MAKVRINESPGIAPRKAPKQFFEAKDVGERGDMDVLTPTPAFANQCRQNQQLALGTGEIYMSELHLCAHTSSLMFNITVSPAASSAQQTQDGSGSCLVTL